MVNTQVLMSEVLERMTYHETPKYEIRTSVGGKFTWEIIYIVCQLLELSSGD